jgi:hypothetical protein
VSRACVLIAVGALCLSAAPSQAAVQQPPGGHVPAIAPSSALRARMLAWRTYLLPVISEVLSRGPERSSGSTRDRFYGSRVMYQAGDHPNA